MSLLPLFKLFTITTALKKKQNCEALCLALDSVGASGQALWVEFGRFPSSLGTCWGFGVSTPSRMFL